MLGQERRHFHYNPTNMPMLYLGLGANLGHRAENIDRALSMIEELIGHVTARSHYYETSPVGFRSEHKFLNAAAAVSTQLPIDRILILTQQIERDLGRTSKTASRQSYADRPIDIDLLIYGTATVRSDGLSLPHVHMHERRFVLEPLVEIAPVLVHPTIGLSMAQLLNRLNQGQIKRLTPSLALAETLGSLNNLLTQLSATAPALTMPELDTLARTAGTHLYLLYDETGAIRATATLITARQLSGLKGWVEDVVTDASCCGRGYASQLLHRIEEEAQTIGISSLQLTSRPARVAANHLYRKEGYALRETNLYRKVL